MEKSRETFWSYVFIIIVGIVLCGFVSVLLCGCVTTGTASRTEPAIIEYQRQIDKLESRIRSYEATTEYAVRELENVTARAEEIGGTVDELIELFDCYQRTVERILCAYRAAESSTENKVEDSYSTGYNTGD